MLERLREELARFIRAATARLDLAVLYPATVRAQADDGSLTVEMDPGAPVPSLVGVPIRHGLPGVTAVTVAVGARVRVGFDGAASTRPFAALWDAGNAARITFNGGTHRAAREGNTVRVTIPIGAVLVDSPSGPVPNAAPITLDGTITEGCDLVRLP